MLPHLTSSQPRPRSRGRRPGTRRRLAALAPLLVAALAPATADAKIIELGQTAQQPVPTCPGRPCLAMSRTTGYQAKVGTQRGIFVVPEPGRVAAWTVALGDPTKKQIRFFNRTLGGRPSAGLTVFRPSKHLYGTITGQSPLEDLRPYLGETVQFPLENTLAVRKGDTVALTTRTWAPALSVGYGTDTSWRASRAKDQCSDTSTQTAVTSIGTVTRFMCLYKTARLTYTVTMITDPHGPRKRERERRRQRRRAN